MDLYITFFSKGKYKDAFFHDSRNKSILEKNKNLSGYLFIYNGFSFGREKKNEDKDLFFSQDSTPLEIQETINKYNPERIWCSISLPSQFDQISSIINEKWIVGGPTIISLSNRKDEIKDRFPKPEFVYTTMEEYLGKELSGDFDPYFIDFVTDLENYLISYSMSIENSTCYWGKCKFCSYSDHYTSTFSKRPDIFGIINKTKLIDNGKNIFVAFTCQSSTRPNTLKEILEFDIPDKTHIHTFIRGDNSIYNLIKNTDQKISFKRNHFAMGIEGLSQKILDELNKGYLLSTAIDIIEECLKRGAFIDITLMSNYSFLTKEIVEEYIFNIEKLRNMLNKYPNKELRIYKMDNPVRWKTKEEAEKFGYQSKRFRNSLFTWYETDLPKDCDQYKFNQKIIEAWGIN